MNFTPEQYRERLERLFVRYPSVQQKGFRSDSYKAGLDGMKALDNLLCNPWRKYNCVHVAGTNGKGSVSSMICASLASGGLAVGLYTSPHILDFRERMRIVRGDRCEMISREEVWEFLEKYESSLPELSFFELTTGMALWWFERRKVDWAVIEVGLGGRLDSTNVILPRLSVITSIGLDHCAMLGNTREEIAAEKAGIFKPGVDALVGFRDDQTSGVFEKIASRTGSPLHFVEKEDILHTDAGGLDLQGPYQQMNLATASKALRLLGFEPNREALNRTAAITGLCGRWETISKSPEIIADIGHNPAALRINFAKLSEHEGPLYIIYGIMADKDLDNIVPLMPSGATVFLCQPSTERALPLTQLYERCRNLRPEMDFRSAGSVGSALEQAMSLASTVNNSLIYVGGSTFVVSDAIFFLHLGG